jgi:hypothetical protein
VLVHQRRTEAFGIDRTEDREHPPGDWVLAGKRWGRNVDHGSHDSSHCLDSRFVTVALISLASRSTRSLTIRCEVS